MDNLTHSLAGFASVELMQNCKPASRKVYVAALVSAVITNNLPDLDFLYTGIVPGKLGYLIHHRGHTHTVPVALIAGLLVGWAAIFWLKRKGTGLSRREKVFVMIAALSGGLLHLFMDSWNTYGVHPFWPLTGRWYYGDSIFIIEPVLWALLLPLLFHAEVSKGLKWLAAICLVGLYILIAWTDYVLPAIAFLLAVSSVGITLLGKGPKRRVAVWVATGTSALSVLGFAALSRVLEHRVATSVENTLILDDVILSPLPANPFCWTLIVSFEDKAKNEGGMRRGILTPFSLVDYARCPKLRGNTSTAPLAPFDDKSGLPVKWSGEYRFSLESFRELARDNCFVRGFLKFSRAPFFVVEKDSLVMGDLRFDWEKELSFSEMRVPLHPQTCPEWRAPWVPPRSDWLGG